MNFELIKEDGLEGNELIERKKFLTEVFTNILDTFPFDTEDKELFIKKISKLENDLEDINDEERFVYELKRVIAGLDNTHTSLQEKVPDKFYIMFPFVYYGAGSFWVDKNGKTMKVLEVDGKPIEEIVSEKMETIGGGTDDWKKNSAIQQLMVSLREQSGILTLEGGENIPVKYLDQEEFKKIKKSDELVSSEIIEDNIAYLSVNTWSDKIRQDDKNVAELIEEKIKKLKDANSLIIDVRKNSGGNSEMAETLAGRFFSEDTKYAHAEIRDGDDYREVDFTIKPQGEFIDKQVVLLTGFKNLSSNELFTLMMKDTGRAKTIGGITGGGSGSPRSFNLKFGDREYKLNVATWKITRNNGKVLENIGIEPDIEVKLTEDDVRQHSDPILEKAIEYLKNN